ILAWFITFNFVNVAWIFFRAKEWEDAIKVLKGMAGLSGVVISTKFSTKLAFLSDYGITFDEVTEHINSGNKSLIWILVGIFFVLFFKNSMERSNDFKFNNTNLFLALVCLIYSILSLNKISEFLYFNF
ncbi:MAG: MBOAT family protein, partial [Aliarcobacter sp.]|nr:MBOAT family protein [Aliarcobacter sp.]